MTDLALPAGIYGRECAAELKRSWRLPQFIVPTVLTPAAFYALFTLAIPAHPSPSEATATLATYGVFAAIGPALFGFGAGIASEREQGLIELKRASPMPAGAYVAAKLVATLAATAAAIMLIDALSLIAGVRLTAAQWGALTLLHLASAIPFALVGFGIGMRMSAKGAVALANVLFLGSAILGGLWFPSQLLPGWMRAIGEVLPSYHLGQLARFLVGADTIGTVATHAAALLAMTAAAFLWARAGWRRSAA
ncbi:ABC-2 type transporter [Gluconacetobacter diazotrophicus PA1 5]|uniref:ABC transporter permease n=1 Tax=Gluconacetobacter diazotrophicus TaxID=33996 RepID=UPI000173AE5A|nr:ABC transporter permease [Gluconacetobacter diazotrophicus]ACI51666.1 ABC-2 type transporter [Gluconacetobacter diazotrophicus PA1 5]TWB11010.1 ABC-2 type transport system permease protein [Gluconacetobacter diazotrophicus]